MKNSVGNEIRLEKQKKLAESIDRRIDEYMYSGTEYYSTCIQDLINERNRIEDEIERLEKELQP